MKIIRRLMLLLLYVFLLTLIFGCTNGNLSTREKEIEIRVIVKKVDADFWAVVKMGTEAAGKEFGVNVGFSGPTDENDIEGQIQMVREAIDKKVDAIVLAASDYTRLVDIVEKAASAKIPVIIIDSELKSNKIVSFIGTDNEDAGKKLGETLVKKVGSDCDIAVMSFIKGTATSDQREAGLLNEIRKYSGIRILTKEYCNSDENIAKQLTEKIIQKYPNIDAVVCLNAYGTVGVARAVDNMKMAGKLKIIGFDSTPEEISYMENDIIQALVIQNPFNMGYLGVKYAFDAIRNHTVSKYTNTGSNVIDKNNMYLPENQKLVFPFTN
jgi:ribose transport system substrate-binding protein